MAPATARAGANAAAPAGPNAAVSAVPTATPTPKSRGKYIALGIFLGGFGIHNFYAGYRGRGVAQLLISLALGWVIIGMLITGVWALIDVCTVKVDAAGIPMA
jgi:TM2 domain-containing membrane protein YozV